MNPIDVDFHAGGGRYGLRGPICLVSCCSIWTWMVFILPTVLPLEYFNPNSCFFRVNRCISISVRLKNSTVVVPWEIMKELPRFQYYQCQKEIQNKTNQHMSLKWPNLGRSSTWTSFKWSNFYTPNLWNKASNFAKSANFRKADTSWSDHLHSNIQGGK